MTQPFFSKPVSTHPQHPDVSVFTTQQDIRLAERANVIARELVDEIARQLTPGMRESEGLAVAEAVFEAHALVKRWHVPYVRFGKHTVLTFRDRPPAIEAVLQENDIAFLDIGPVIELDGQLIEGDYGATFTWGHHPMHQALKDFSEDLFQQGLAYWKAEQPTGVTLYDYLHRQAQQAGFMFNLPHAGHLIGSFPHQGWREGLSHYPFVPETGMWILEIQVRHPEYLYGAFFEDILA